MTTTTELPQVHDLYSEEDIASFYGRGLWTDQSMWDVIAQQVRDKPDAVFLSDGTRTLTYRELSDQAQALASVLHDRGVRPGERVVVQLPNWVEFAVALAANSRLGVVTVPIMTIYRNDEVAYILEHAGAVATVCPQEFGGFDYLAMHRALSPGTAVHTNLVVRRTSDIGEALSFDDAVAGEVADLPAAASADDVHLIIYTSGTTARPKGCVHTFNTIASSGRLMARHLGWSADDVAFGPSPIAHATGYMTSVLGPLMVGMHSHLMEKWEPSEGLRRIEQHGCTVTTTATPFLQMLVGAYDAEKHDPSSMRLWVAAGAPIPPAVIESGRKILDGCEILSLYGRSENFLTTMCSLGDPPERATNSDGKAVEGVEVKVVDEFGSEVPRGDDGDVAYRGPSHMLAYFRNPEETQKLFTPDGFSRSGDLGIMDEEGYVRITGRTKDIIIRGGTNISAREIEDHLLVHDAVANVAVVAMPDERLGEKACAYVVLTDGAAFDLDEMTRFLTEKGIAIQKRPERLEIVEQLPMTATGKIQKHVLRQDVAGKLEADA